MEENVKMAVDLTDGAPAEQPKEGQPDAVLVQTGYNSRGEVILAFDRPIASLTFTAEEAVRMGETLMSHALQCGYSPISLPGLPVTGKQD